MMKFLCGIISILGIFLLVQTLVTYSYYEEEMDYKSELTQIEG
jgi:hypothetical protein